MGSLYEWVREDGEWTIPDGRPGELLGLTIVLPVVAVAIHVSRGLPTGPDVWGFCALGLVAGFLYTGAYRARVVDRVPVVSGWTIISMVAGGFGLSILEAFYLADPAVAFLLTAGATVFAVYLFRLCSPVHRDLEPSRRGVEPPPAIETEQ